MKKIDDRYFVNPNLDQESLEACLEADEQILWRGKPYKKSFILSSVFRFLPVAVIFLLFDLTFLIMLGAFFDGLPWFVYIFIAVFFCFHLLPLWIWIAGIVSSSKRQQKEEYAFTSKRIIVKQGLIGSSIVSIYYPSLTSVNLKIGLIEKLCKVGDIYIVAANQRAVLEDIKDPYFIASRLQGIANDIKADIYYPNDLRPKDNHGYNSQYKGANDPNEKE